MTLSRLPLPAALGLPADKFPMWRPRQEQMIWDCFESPKRFIAIVAPTGAGKSAVYAAYTALNGDRCVVLTSTKSLQTQLIGDFASMQWRDVRGQSNYVCRLDAPHTVAEGPCHAGVQCDLRRSGCHYYDAVRAARAASVAQTNYSFWMTHATAPEFTDAGIGKFDTVICDEAHSAPDELGKYLSVHISLHDIRDYLGGARPPVQRWPLWAQQVLRRAEEHLADYTHVSERDRHTIARVRRIKDLIRKLQRLAAAKEHEWVAEATFFRRTMTGYRYDPIWPGPYAESLLFQGARRVIFISATIREKTLQLLGLKPEDYDFREYPSDFPVTRRPIIYVPTIPVTWRTPPALFAHWHKQIDTIIAARQDRKGLIHTVSYARQAAIIAQSRFARAMISHVPASDFTDPDANTQATAITIFRKASPPALLISPSITTGLDFPGEDAEYQIITKIPFPDQRAKILKARTKGDREYPYYIAMMDLVQACGRIMRFREDRGETVIIDNNFSWFIWKFRKFAPKWFVAAVRRLPPVMDAVTPPPKPPISLRAERATKGKIR